MEREVIYIASSSDTALVRIIGKGTFQNSYPIKKWFLSKIEEKCANLIIDLKDCTGMDSTFMGTITGLSLKAKSLGKKAVVLANITRHNRHLLETLGLDKFFILKEVLELDRFLNWQMLSIEDLDKLTTTKHMIEAHEKLIVTGGSSGEQFKAVDKLLKENIQKQIKNKKDTKT